MIIISISLGNNKSGCEAIMKLTIDVNKIEEIFNSLKSTIDDYESINDVFFSTINEASSFWHDNISISFFSETKSAKEVNKRIIVNLKERYNIFLYMKNSYMSIGKKIKCDLLYKDNIINYLNNIVNKLSYCLKIYNSMDYSFCTYYEKNRIYFEKNKLSEVYNDIVSVRKKISNAYKKIDDIEKELKRRLSKIDEFIVQEFPIDRFIGEN